VTWDWFAFVLGAVVGVVFMWVGMLVVAVLEEVQQEQTRAWWEDRWRR